MHVSRLATLTAALLLASGLAACGNKADLFMPPPPEDEPVLDEQETDESAVEAVGDETPVGPPGQPVPPPAAGPADPPLPVPTGDE